MAVIFLPLVVYFYPFDLNQGLGSVVLKFECSFVLKFSTVWFETSVTKYGFISEHQFGIHF